MLPVDAKHYQSQSQQIQLSETCIPPSLAQSFVLNASAEGVTSTDIHYCILTNGQQGCPDNEVESALREVLKRLATPSDLIRFIHGSSVSEAKSTEILRVLNKKISEVLIRSKGEEFSGQGNALSNRSTKTRSDDDITPSHQRSISPQEAGTALSSCFDMQQSSLKQGNKKYKFYFRQRNVAMNVSAAEQIHRLKEENKYLIEAIEENLKKIKRLELEAKRNWENVEQLCKAFEEAKHCFNQELLEYKCRLQEYEMQVRTLERKKGSSFSQQCPSDDELGLESKVEKHPEQAGHGQYQKDCSNCPALQQQIKKLAQELARVSSQKQQLAHCAVREHAEVPDLKDRVQRLQRMLYKSGAKLREKNTIIEQLLRLVNERAKK